VLLCSGILAVQCVTISLASYAFARMRFPGRDLLFHAFLLQLMLVPPMLIVPNLTTLVALHLYDTLPGVMAPYCVSVFGVFLMRQTFRTIPAAYEEAALIDGASRLQIIARVLLPLARPGLVAFAIVSVTAHWNEFLWPLMATSSPSTQVLAVGLASFTAGAQAGSEWGIIAAGTFLVAAPLAFTLIFGTANAQTELELFFPVPVQGKLANEMQRLIEEFDASHPAIHITAVYTGSYDDTNLKTRAAIQAGKPPGAVIMSANFVHTRSTTMRSHWMISSLGVPRRGARRRRNIWTGSGPR